MALIFRRRQRLRLCLSYSSTAAKPVQPFRTDKADPGDHTKDDIGLFYNLPRDVAHQKLFKYGGWPTQYLEQLHTFQEATLMIRKPGLEILHYLKTADYSLPINKYLIYGRKGAGKSLVLSYVLHYGYLHGWLIVHLPWVPAWLTHPGEVTPCLTREHEVHLNKRSWKWLNQFKILNMKILSENELFIQNDYKWNIRESSKSGDQLLSVVEYGISRGSFSSEVLISVLSEVKNLSKAGKIKTLVLIDGYNALFHSKSKVRLEQGEFIPSERIAPLKPFFDLTTADWHNGAAVLVCDEIAVPGHNESRFPLYQLTLKGFEHIFPFVPIEVPRFTDMEFRNMLSYYRERRWLRTDTGDKELKYLSGQNGYELMRVCAPL